MTRGLRPRQFKFNSLIFSMSIIFYVANFFSRVFCRKKTGEVDCY